jgi:hypothetical protein
MAYTKASAALRIAKDKLDMSYKDTADLCGVNVGSVKRWMLTGRADEKAIQPLLEIIGPVYLNVSQIADHLVQLYRNNQRRNKKGFLVRRFSVTSRQMEDIAGREYLKATIKSDLIDECRERGFVLLEGTDDFIMILWKWLYEGCAAVGDDEIPEFYEKLADMEDDDDDSGD